MENPAEGLVCRTEIKTAELQLQSRKPCKKRELWKHWSNSRNKNKINLAVQTAKPEPHSLDACPSAEPKPSGKTTSSCQGVTKLGRDPGKSSLIKQCWPHSVIHPVLEWEEEGEKTFLPAPYFQAVSAIKTLHRIPVTWEKGWRVQIQGVVIRQNWSPGYWDIPSPVPAELTGIYIPPSTEALEMLLQWDVWFPAPEVTAPTSPKVSAVTILNKGKKRKKQQKTWDKKASKDASATQGFPQVLQAIFSVSFVVRTQHLVSLPCVFCLLWEQTCNRAR